MIESPEEWAFAKAKATASGRGMRVTGLYGYAVNSGSTQWAMEEVLMRFKKVRYVTAIKISLALVFKGLYMNIMSPSPSAVYQLYSGPFLALEWKREGMAFWYSL